MLERVRRRILLEEGMGRAPPDAFSHAAPWSSCFLLAAQDTQFWDDEVRHLAQAWVAGGSRGVLETPDKKNARDLPGGVASVTPQVELTPSQKKRQAKVTRVQSAKEELDSHCAHQRFRIQGIR
eukprot:5167126-Amphidinium_carterae.1